MEINMDDENKQRNRMKERGKENRRYRGANRREIEKRNGRTNKSNVLLDTIRYIQVIH